MARPRSIRSLSTSRRETFLKCSSEDLYTDMGLDEVPPLKKHASWALQSMFIIMLTGASWKKGGVNRSIHSPAAWFS